MILIRNIYSKKERTERLPLPQEIFESFFQSLLNLFECESLQVVSIAASILFNFSAQEIKDDPSFPLISTFAEYLQQSENPFTIFGFSCLLFDLCQTFQLPNEVVFSVISAVFQQLNTGTLPPVVSSRLIALFRSTIPSYSPEFISSECFQECLKMLVELTKADESKNESYITWAMIISTFPQFADEILEENGEISLVDMTNSDDIATLISTCIFWSDTCITFASNTQPLIQFTEPLLLALHRVLLIRGSDQLREEFDELPQAARHTLKTLLRFTPGTSPAIVAEIVDKQFEEGIEEKDILEINALLIFYTVIAASESCSYIDPEKVVFLLHKALESGSQLLLFNALKLATKVFFVLPDKSIFTEIVPQIFAIAGEEELDIACKGQLTKTMGRIAQSSEFHDCQLEATAVLLQFAHSSVSYVSSRAFNALTEIGSVQEPSDVYPESCLLVHQQIVPDLLQFLEESISDITEEDNSAIEVVNDICSTLVSFITTMGDMYEQFAEKTIELLSHTAEITHSSYSPLSVVAAKFPELFADYLEHFVEILVQSIGSQDDERTSAAANCFFLIAERFDVSPVIPTVVESLFHILESCDRSYSVLQYSTELIMELKRAGVEISLAGFVPTIPKLISAFGNAYDEDGDFGIVAANFIIYCSAIIEDADEENKEAAITASCELADKACSVCSRVDTVFIGSILVFVKQILSINPEMFQSILESSQSISEMLTNAKSFPLELHDLLADVGLIHDNPEEEEEEEEDVQDK